MRQSLILLLCVSALLLTACGTGGSNPPEESVPVGSTTTANGGNEFDGADWFGTTTDHSATDHTTTGDTVTTTGAPSGSAADTSVGSTTTTTVSTAEAPTVATTTSTTVAPPRQQEQNSVSLPATGYDPDGKGRLLLGEVTLRGQTVYMEVCNISATWMTEETAYYQYTCYDKNGRVLTLSEETFGYIYLGQLRAGRSKTYTFTLPQGTRRVEITGYHVPYWTEWS